MYAFMDNDMKLEWAELLRGDLVGANDEDGSQLNTVPDFIKAYEFNPRFIRGEDGGFLGVQLITPWDAILDTALGILTVQLKNEWVTIDLPLEKEWKHDLKDFYFGLWVHKNMADEKAKRAQYEF